MKFGVMKVNFEAAFGKPETNLFETFLKQGT
jgi:hypothetical protein